MKPIEYKTLDEIAQSNLTQELAAQTLQNIQQMQVPTQTGFTPKTVVLPLMENIMNQQTEKEAELRQQQPPQMPKYYLAVNGEQKGPFTVPQIKDFVARGIITTNDLCWAPGFSGWIAISSTPEFD